jgi:hyperosmotically inducible protein
MLAAVTLLVSSSAYADTAATEQAGKYIDDVTLTAKVKTSLVESPEVKARQVDVETFRGVVQLNGFVDSEEAKSAATRVAGSVEGVQEVRNNLVVYDSQTTTGYEVNDSVVTGKVKAALIADPLTKARQINVETRKGVVQLSGFVDSAEEKSKAAELARSVSGVRDVQNELDIKQAP